MKNFFTLLLTVGIFGSVASVLSDGSSLGKYVKYVSALVCVTIIISPLSSILKGFSKYAENEFSKDFQSFNESFEADLKDRAFIATEKQIKEKIKEKFGIIPTHISIVIDGEGKISIDFSVSIENGGYAPFVYSLNSSFVKLK
jgi:hypothetical protein